MHVTGTSDGSAPMKRSPGFRPVLFVAILWACAGVRPLAAEYPPTGNETQSMPFLSPKDSAVPPLPWIRLEATPGILAFPVLPNQELEADAVTAGIYQVPQPTESPWWSWKANTVVRNTQADQGLPSSEEQWHADQSLSLPVCGPLSLFGQMGAGSKLALAEELRVLGRAGVACKLPTLLGAELQVRGGPQLSCIDPHMPEKMQEHSELLFDMQCRVP